VVTSYVTTNPGGAISLMNLAESLGMTVVAGAANSAGAGTVWPAADPRAISVADTTPSGSSLTLDPTVQTWVKFGLRGDFEDRASGGPVVDWGSSYASAKVGGIVAYYQRLRPLSDRIEVEAVLASLSKPREQRNGRVRAVVAEIDSGGWQSRIMEAVRGRDVVASSDAGWTWSSIPPGVR
jgi:hypothetical protein